MKSKIQSDGSDSQDETKSQDHQQKGEVIWLKQNILPDEIMERLNLNRLRKLQNFWKQNPNGGLDLEEFIKVVLQEVPHQSVEKIELIQGAVKLFKEVDINNDGTMEWEEFVQYIMDQVSSESIKPTVDRILGLKLSIAEIVSQRSDGEYRRFKKSTDHSYTDQGKHVKRIVNTVACLGSSTNVIIHAEENQPILQFYTTEMQVLHRFTLPVEKKNVSVLSIAFQEFKLKKDVVGYSGSTALFVATCSDGCIYLYLKCMGEFRYWRCFSTGDVQNKIWFLPVQKVWLTTTRDFKL